MTGILELFALLEVGSGIGFLVRWRNRLLASKVNYFRPPHNKKSPFDKLVRAQSGPVITPAGPTLRQAGRRPYRPTFAGLSCSTPFRQLMRALALPHSPLRRRLRGQRRLSCSGGSICLWLYWLHPRRNDYSFRLGHGAGHSLRRSSCEEYRKGFAEYCKKLDQEEVSHDFHSVRNHSFSAGRSSGDWYGPRWASSNGAGPFRGLQEVQSPPDRAALDQCSQGRHHHP